MIKNIFQSKAAKILTFTALFSIASSCATYKDPYNHMQGLNFSDSYADDGTIYVLYTKNEEPFQIERRTKRDKRIDSKDVSHLTLAQAKWLKNHYVTNGALAWNEDIPLPIMQNKTILAQNNIPSN